MEERYSRNRIYVRPEEQKLVKNYRILLAGAGIGSIVAECALRFGFETITIVDGDVVEESNLNRQNYRMEDIGKSKAEALKERLLSINPNANITSINTFIDTDNVEDIVKEHDIAINALDFKSDIPFVFDEWCQKYNISVNGVVQARFSVLYDVLNRFVLDGCLSPLSVGERTLAYGHLSFAKKGDLILYDRGYPSFELVYEHFARGVDFLIRVKTDFSNVVKGFYQSGLSTDVVAIRPGKNVHLSDKPYSRDASAEVRLVRVELPTGEIEILMTSLFDVEKYPDSLLKELYFLRWGVETFYDEVKNKMSIEYFSGYSAHSILQDFYATLFVSNVQSLLVGELNDELAKESKANKYQYKVNTNLSYGFLKDRVITLFLSDREMDDIVAELKQLFKIDKVPIRPNRKVERNVGKYRKREKPKCFKNKKNAI